MTTCGAALALKSNPASASTDAMEYRMDTFDSEGPKTWCDPTIAPLEASSLPAIAAPPFPKQPSAIVHPWMYLIST
jgi:hypothetical protein